MKKQISLVAFMAAAVLLAGCGEDGSAGKSSSQAPSVSEVLEAGVAEANEAVTENAESAVTEEKPAATESAASADVTEAGTTAAGTETAASADVTEAGTTAAATEATVSTDAEETVSVADATEIQAGRQSGVDENAPVPATNENTAEAAAPVASASDSDGIDVDLTTLSSTMVYSEVYNMMVYPQDYIGKTIKMNGTFSAFHDEASGNNYFSCVIQDATACCSQGLEFELTDKYVFPQDYPEMGDEIAVVGEFDTYKEGEYTYCTLRDAELV